MRAGELNQRVSLLRNEPDSDAANDLVDNWVSVSDHWASVRYVSGLATIRAGGELSIVKASIRMRMNRTLGAGMRIRHAEDVYTIEAVLPDKTGRIYADLVCRLLMPRELAQ